MNLTHEKVQTIILDCLYGEGENHDDKITVEGVVSTFGFKPDRLDAHKADIAELPAELPRQFQPIPEGGGRLEFPEYLYGQARNSVGGTSRYRMPTGARYCNQASSVLYAQRNVGFVTGGECPTLR